PTGLDNVYIVIWTTTPWTLPANRAIAYGEDIVYQQIKVGNERLWVAKDLAPKFISDCGITDHELTEVEVKGVFFREHMAKHPLYKNRIIPMLPGHHVTTDAGTGFVHTAPAHGYDDFLIGKEHGLELACPVAGDGRYEDFVDADAAADELQL